MFDLIAAARTEAPRMMRRVLIAAALSTFFGFTGCSSNSPTTGPSGGKVTGTWVLESVDDEEPPVAVHRGAWLDPATGVFYNNFVFQVTGGYLEIRENETFYLSLQYRATGDGQTAQGNLEFEGEWDLVADEVVLRVQFPIVGTQVLEREDGALHTDIDFMGLGEVSHLHFEK